MKWELTNFLKGMWKRGKLDKSDLEKIVAGGHIKKAAKDEITATPKNKGVG